MTNNAWERLIDSIDATVGIKLHTKKSQPLKDRPELSEQVEVFEFERGGNNFRLERISGPAIIERKSHYSHRAGTANRIENVYDESDIGHKVTLYREVSGNWEPQDLSDLAG